MVFAMKSTIFILVLLFSIPACWAKHNYEQGTVVETHTQNEPAGQCWIGKDCRSTAATIKTADHIYYILGLGSAGINGYYPDLFRVGDTITFDKPRPQTIYIESGGKHLHFWITRMD
jgi:hypothetical protein